MRLLVKVLFAVFVISIIGCSELPTAATIGPEKITIDELSSAIQRKASLLGINSLTPDLKRDVLDLLIQRDVLYLSAKEQGIELPKEEYQKITRNISFTEKWKMGKSIKKRLFAEQMRKKIIAPVHISQEEVHDYFNSHKSEFRVPEQYKVYLVKVSEEMADHVLSRVKQNPEAFDDMALNTETEELRQINKNAPYTPKDGFPEEMWPFLEKMKKGDIGGPVKVARGIFLFKLVDRVPAFDPPFSKVSARIEHLVLAEKQAKAIDEWYEKQKEQYEIRVLVQDFASLN